MFEFQKKIMFIKNRSNWTPFICICFIIVLILLTQPVQYMDINITSIAHYVWFAQTAAEARWGGRLQGERNSSWSCLESYTQGNNFN